MIDTVIGLVAFMAYVGATVIVASFLRDAGQHPVPACLRGFAWPMFLGAGIAIEMRKRWPGLFDGAGS